MYDLMNGKFGSLEVIGYLNKDVCICKCDCKKIILIPEIKLKNKNITSCGHKNIKETDKTRLKRIYDNMKSRCYNKNNISYKYYGKKGIKVYKKWLDKENGFNEFYKWAVNNGYQKDLTIDRINSNKSYNPKNCRWVDMFIQNNNRDYCHYITYNNKTLTLSQWAKKCNITPGNLLHKINKKGEETALTELLNNKDV